jgi:pantothenate synthetase
MPICATRRRSKRSMALGSRPARVLVAAHLGKARLIDNWPVE